MFSTPDDPLATSTTSTVPLLRRSCTSAPLGLTTILLVTGFAPHHLSFATSATAPSSLTESSLYGPDDGKRFRSIPGVRFQVLFQACAMRSMLGPSLLMMALVTSTPSSSAMK